MADQGGKWVTAIIAITGILLSSGLFGPTIVNLVTKPWVNLVIKPNNNQALFEMQNVGVTPATHVRLVINTPTHIVSYSNFSTDNMSVSLVNKTSPPFLLIGNLKRFANGDGSNVMVNLTVAWKPNVDYIYGYSAYATYDQGSAKGSLYYPYLTPFGLFIVVVVVAGLAPLAYYLIVKYILVQKVGRAVAAAFSGPWR
jgi:hypothetical protein